MKADTFPKVGGQTYGSTTYRYFVLGLLTLVYVFGFVDRQVISILGVYIIEDLQLSDAQFGALSGFAFAAIYVTVGIPLGRWADLGVRRNVVTVSLAVWSAMTAVCGLTQNFWQLFFARAGVGVGEAGCSPPSHSIISDIFPKRFRSTAISIYSTGAFIGILVAYIAGARLAEAFNWRVAFFVVGVPGVLLALIVRLVVREPQRTTTVAQGPSFNAVFKTLWCKPCFRHIVIAASLHSFVGYGLSGFLPLFFSRVHQMPQQVIGDNLGLVVGFGGVIGVLLGGYVSDRLSNSKDDARWQLWVPMISTIVAVPFFYAVLLFIGDGLTAIWFYLVPSIISGMYLGPTLAITHGLVDSRSRAMASAVMLFFINLLGLGLGPWITGALSDYFAPVFAQEAIRYALALMVLAHFWSAIHYWLGSKDLRESLL